MATALKKLREQNDRLRLDMERRQLEQGQKLMESIAAAGWGLGYRGSWQDPEERAANIRDGYLPPGSMQEYKTGSKYPIFNSEAELKEIRDLARVLAETNPYVMGLLGGLQAMVIGNGYTYRFTAKKDQEPPDELVAAGQKHIDDWIRRELWGEMEQEVFLTTEIEGESILRIFDREDGTIHVRAVESEQITQPPKVRWGDEWAYGVHVDPEDKQRVLGYWVTDTGVSEDGEEIDASEIEHIKINVKRITRRGLSSLFAVQGVADGALKLLRNMEISGAIQAAIALIVQQSNTTKAQADEFLKAADFMKPASNGNGAVSSRRVRYEPGTRVDLGENSEYKEPPMSSKNTGNFISIVQAALRCLSVRWNAPEYLTGDSSNANFASSLVSESPFVRRAEMVQEFYRVRFLRIMTRLFKSAIRAGLFPENMLDLCEVIAEPPSLAVRNKLEQAEVNDIERRNNVLSVQTWQAESGRDSETEIQNQKEFETLGLKPPGTPGTPPMPGQPGWNPLGEGLLEGGPGSGVKGHTTPEEEKAAQAAAAAALPDVKPNPPATVAKKTFGKSKAKAGKDGVTVGFGSKAAAEKIFGTITDKAAILEKASSLVGAPDNAKVSVRGGGRGKIEVLIDHPSFTATRILGVDKEGKKYIVNDTFFVKGSAQGKGLGAEVFGRQVENAAANGFSYIKAHAAKDNLEDPSKPLNGYYTWPRFGYNAYIPDDVKSKLPPSLQSYKTVEGVMRTKEGRDWWKANGTDLDNARFDLRDGSVSHRVFNAYMAEKAAK